MSPHVIHRQYMAAARDLKQLRMHVRLKCKPGTMQYAKARLKVAELQKEVSRLERLYIERITR